MEKQAALHILQTLAQGTDPHTGETFPGTSPYQHPDTVRALYLAIQALAEPMSARSRPSAHAAPTNAGKPWNDDEDKLLAEGFDAARSIAELAEHHQRTRAAIQARLVRLGKVEPPAEPPRFSRLTGIMAQT